MSELDDIVTTLDLVSPPQTLLAAHGDDYIPVYSLQAFQHLDKPFHMGVGIQGFLFWAPLDRFIGIRLQNLNSFTPLLRFLKVAIFVGFLILSVLFWVSF